MKIGNKIKVGYIVMALVCAVMGFISYYTIGLDSVSAMAALAAAVLGIVFAVGYGLYMSKQITEPIMKIKFVVEELSKGHLKVRTQVHTEDEIGQTAKSLDFFVDLLQKDLIGAIESIADGDIKREFASKDEKDEIAVILQKMSYTLRRINDSMGKLIYDVSEGKLDSRGDEDLFNGAWKELVRSTNHLIDSFVKPINVTSEYIDGISKGVIPPKITEEYKGDFNIIKTNINFCIDMMNGLLDGTSGLIGAAQSGHLDARGDSSMFRGSWKDLVDAVNLLMETVAKPIKEVSETMQELSRGNLDIIVKGSYEGEFGKLADAVNVTLERLHAVVNEISTILGRISDGDLTINEVQQFDGNFESISVSLNKIVSSLNNVMGDIQTASDQVSTGAGQVADGSQLLAQGATEQASSIEELTAAITEVASQTKENAANANQANQLVTLMKQNAQQGNNHMGEMLEAMKEINEASNNISKVIKVIDDMAFQTNILALNAAVEAARAGQHGKGFAVVAEEVRNLAAKSANAAKETTALIEGSIHRAKRGEEIANQTARALNEIVDGVSQAVDLISGIAISSNEQATGISQINVGLNQVSEVVQTNSATSEQSAAASQELSGQSELLTELVNQFTLKGDMGNAGRGKKRNGTNQKDYMKRDRYAIVEKPQIILSDSEFGKY